MYSFDSLLFAEAVGSVHPKEVEEQRVLPLDALLQHLLRLFHLALRVIHSFYQVGILVL